MNTDEIRKRHHPTAELWWRCICGADYPCDAIRLADELDRVRAELAQTQDIAIDYAELYEATTNTTPVASQDARSAEKVDQHAALLDERRYADLMTRSAEQKKSPD